MFMAGRLLGGSGKFSDLLRIYGVFMFSYLVIGVLNFAHLFISIPFLRLSTSEIFNPGLGIGQLTVFVWLSILSYIIARKVHNLSKINAVLIAALPSSIGIVLYMLSVAICFNFYKLLPDIGLSVYLFSGLMYIIFTVLLTFIFLRVGYDQK